MYNNDAELLFPERVIKELPELRTQVWHGLVQEALIAESDSLERMAFVLMMVRLNGCTTCNADSFRAMRGCTQCAIQTIRRYRGKDQDLVKSFNEACKEIACFREKDIEREKAK
jgi:hypothetical protein